MQELVQKLKNKKLKVTPQRLAIYQMLNSTTAHPNAETIYKTLEPFHPTLSLATVYKTLDTLKNAGLIQEINVGEDSNRYDATTQNHPHLICNICHEVFDYSENINLENFTTKMEVETGFLVESSKLYFYGVCEKCCNIGQIAK